MTLIKLYLLNNDWQADTKIMVHRISGSETMEMRKAIYLYGRERVLCFSQSGVVLYEN